MKVLKSLVAGLLVMLVCISPCFAFVYQGDLSDEEAVKDPKYWHQGYCPNFNIMLNDGPNGQPVAEAGCGYFAASFALYKMGLMDGIQDNPEELIKWAKSGKHQSTDWGHLEFKDLPQRYPGLEVDYGGTEIKGFMGEESIVPWVKAKMKEGWFVILMMGRTSDSGAHYVTVDEVTSDNHLVIADSGYPNSGSGQKFFKDDNSYGTRGSYDKVGIVGYTVLLKHSNANPLICKSVYGGRIIINGNNFMSESDKSAYNRIHSEWELAGMKYITDPAKTIMSAEELVFADRKDLTFNQQLNVGEIKDGINSRQAGVWNVFSLAVRIVGLLLIVYSVLLFGAIVFDKSNSVLDISMTTLLTAGFVKYDTKTNNQKIFFLGRVGVMLVFGILLSFNIIPDLIYRLVVLLR